MLRSGDGSARTTSFKGQAGLAQLSASARIAVPDVDAFQAHRRDISTDGVDITAWTTTPLTGSARLCRAQRTIVIVAVSRGGLRYSLNGNLIEGGPGSLHVLAATRPLRFAVPQRSTVLRLVLPEAVLPLKGRDLVGVDLGEIAESPLTSTLLTLTESVLDPAGGGNHSPACRTIRPLALAVLEGLTAEDDARGGRDRILAHIEHNLADPTLSPHSIAGDLGMSVRWVHQLFNDDQWSISRYIRERRLDRVVAQLDTDLCFPRIGTLAAAHGFSSRGHLSRAFKARFGTPIAEYASESQLRRM